VTKLLNVTLITKNRD